MSDAPPSGVGYSSNDGLAVIAHKIAAHTFDISTGLSEYSIRDQIVRGALFGESLAASRAYVEGANVLIIGAGVAGITCGAALARNRINAYLLDAAETPFSLFAKASRRYVSPFLYEWPSLFATQHSFMRDGGFLFSKIAPQFPDWESATPLTASELAGKLTAWLEAFLKSDEGEHLFIYTKCARETVSDFAEKFAMEQPAPSALSLPDGATDYSGKVRGTAKNPTAVLRVDCLVLAAGAESEKVDFFPDFKTKSFWTDDSEDLENAGGKDIGVFGNGDGAFQDFLRYAFPAKHPLALFQSLPESFKKRSEGKFASLLSYEIAAKRLSLWGEVSQSLELIDAKCAEIVKNLVRESDRASLVSELLSASRDNPPKAVTLIRSEGPGKCYLLNRFMVHLIETLQVDLSEASKTAIKVIRHKGHLKNGTRNGGRFSIEIPPHDARAFDWVIVRFGGKGEKRSLGREVMVSITNSSYPARVCFENLILPYEPFVPKTEALAASVTSYGTSPAQT